MTRMCLLSMSMGAFALLSIGSVLVSSHQFTKWPRSIQLIKGANGLAKLNHSYPAGSGLDTCNAYGQDLALSTCWSVALATRSARLGRVYHKVFISTTAILFA